MGDLFTRVNLTGRPAAYGTQHVRRGLKSQVTITTERSADVVSWVKLGEIWQHSVTPSATAGLPAVFEV